MRTAVKLFDVLEETLDKLDGDGLLLVAGDPPNPMTIGWGTIGHIWNKLIFTVMVRPVRHTFSLMESANSFTLCILPDSFRKELHICGTQSGRDINKIETCNFSMEKNIGTDGFFIGEAAVHFECRIVHKHRLDPATLDAAISKRYYPSKDFHMVYYGEILGIYRNT